MDQHAAPDFAAAAAHLKPLLNRAVFYGIETCRGQLDSQDRVRAPVFPLRRLHALTTSQLSRLTPELMTAGFTRIDRPGSSETWNIGRGLTLTLESSAEGSVSESDAGVLEYATLLTRTLSFGDDIVMRVSALPAQLALMWRAHRQSGLEFSASSWAEDLIELVVRRAAIRADAAALPTELRMEVAKAASEFVASDAALWTIARALPDARTTPGSAVLALERFRQLAALTP